jgi:hypothetical protein
MPRLSNIWVNPKTRLLADTARGDGAHEAVLEVSGMLCEVG